MDEEIKPWEKKRCPYCGEKMPVSCFKYHEKDQCEFYYNWYRNRKSYKRLEAQLEEEERGELSRRDWFKVCLFVFGYVGLLITFPVIMGFFTLFVLWILVYVLFLQ